MRMDYNFFLELAKDSIKERNHVGEGSFENYRENVEAYKSEHSDIIEQYGLTDSELFVMFMMLVKNSDEIQQCASSGNGTQFAKECVCQYDSFLSKVPISESSIFFGLDASDRVGNYVSVSTINYKNYMIASTSQSIFDNFQNGVKFVIKRRLIGITKAHEVFKIFNANDEFRVNFERNTRFKVDGIDKKDKFVFLTEL